MSVKIVKKKDSKKIKGIPPESNIVLKNMDKKNRNKVILNFEVTENFRKEYKVFALNHDLTMKEVLENSFRALKNGMNKKCT